MVRRNHYKYLDSTLSTVLVVLQHLFSFSGFYPICIAQSNCHTHNLLHIYSKHSIQFMRYIYLRRIAFIDLAFTGFSCVYLHECCNTYGQSYTLRELKCSMLIQLMLFGSSTGICEHSSEEERKYLQIFSKKFVRPTNVSLRWT